MQAMTPHEINLAIGKSLGFEQCPTAMCQGFPPELCYRKDTYIGELPDFYESLDRMHEVERSMPQAYYTCWLDNLCLITCGENGQMDGSYDEVSKMLLATSQQRAEAYLRTLNLWTNTNAPSRQDATVNNPPPSM